MSQNEALGNPGPRKESGEATRPAGRQEARLWLRGAWLLALYITSIIAVTVALTAYQLQHNIRTFDAGGTSLAVWRILQLRESWNQLQSAKASAEVAVAEARGNVDRLTLEANRARQDWEAADLVLTDARQKLERALLAVGTAADAVGVSVEQTIRVYANLAPEKKTPDVVRAYDDFVAKQDHENETENIHLGAEGKLDDADGELTARTAVLDDVGSKFSLILEGLGDERVSNATGDFLTQLNYLSSIPGGRFFEFGAMANDMLTLILVLAMGALGGTIHLTQIYLAGESRSASYYLFRPLLGAITALAVYVVARAGLFVLSDPSASSARSPLSPFFISFLAIISGLLAERAIMSIENLGSRWFSSAMDQERWAMNVSQEMIEQKKAVSDIEPLLNADAAMAAAWLEQRQPVPLSAQRVISAWLGKPIRDLFSDLPPPRPTES